jgi:hypothetical protein
MFGHIHALLRARVFPSLLVLAMAVLPPIVGCGSSHAAVDAGVFMVPLGDGGGTRDSGSAEAEAAASETGGADAQRNASCAPLNQETGTLVNTTHGRLDGTLVYVIPPGGPHSCNGDDSHVHMQISVSGLIYDVAVDIGSASGGDVGYDELTLALPGGAWSEGWHGSDTLAYPALGLHTASFTTLDPTDMATKVESWLATVSQVSVFCTGYSQGDGCHDVHYKDGSGEDGAIVLDPLAATPSILFFRFTDQSF